MTGDLKKKDNGLYGVEAALRRAAMRAREIAYQTQTPLVVVRDGKIVRVKITKSDLSDSE